MQTSRYSCHILIKLEFSRQTSEKYPIITFHENASSVSRNVRCGQTEMNLIIAFHNFGMRQKNGDREKKQPKSRDKLKSGSQNDIKTNIINNKRMTDEPVDREI